MGGEVSKCTENNRFNTPCLGCTSALEVAVQWHTPLGKLVNWQSLARSDKKKEEKNEMLGLATHAPGYRVVAIAIWKY